MSEIYKALAKAQEAMGPALKTSTNPHFKKTYADLGAVQEACFDALRKNGFAVFQPIGRDDAGLFVKTVFAHETGETLECVVPLIVDKNDMQRMGSAITYARRYGLMAMAGIAPEDDDGNGAAKKPTHKPEQQDKQLSESEKAEREAKTEGLTVALIDQIEGLAPDDVGALLQETQTQIAWIAKHFPAHFKRIEAAAAKAGAPMRKAA